MKTNWKNAWVDEFAGVVKKRISISRVTIPEYHICPCRRSQRRCSVRDGVLKNFAKLAGKHLYQSLFFNKVAGLSPATLLKKRLWYRCFPVKFAKFLKTPFLQITYGRLLLTKVVKLFFPTKVNFMGGFCTVRIENHLANVSQIINFTQIVV